MASSNITVCFVTEVTAPELLAFINTATTIIVFLLLTAGIRITLYFHFYLTQRSSKNNFKEASNMSYTKMA